MQFLQFNNMQLFKGATSKNYSVWIFRDYSEFQLSGAEGFNTDSHPCMSTGHWFQDPPRIKPMGAEVLHAK